MKCLECGEEMEDWRDHDLWWGWDEEWRCRNCDFLIAIKHGSEFKESNEKDRSSGVTQA